MVLRRAELQSERSLATDRIECGSARMAQNCPRLRSARQTALAEIFPSHVVYAWLGNSEDIAKKHYYQVTDAHFARAAAGANPSARTPPRVFQEATHNPTHSRRKKRRSRLRHQAARKRTTGRNSLPQKPLCGSMLNCAATCGTFKRMGWDSSGENTPSAWIHGVCDATPLAARIYVCLAACGGNRSETVFGGHSQHTSSTRDFPRR